MMGLKLTQATSKRVLRTIHASFTPTATVTLCARSSVIAFLADNGGPGRLRRASSVSEHANN